MEFLPPKLCICRWISESIAAGRLLDFRSFLLYGAITNSQPKISFDAGASGTAGTSGTSETSGKHGTSPIKSAKDANDSAFLGEFYNNSRLHHISTMGANFKNYVAKLREERGRDDASFPAREELRGSAAPDAEFSPFEAPVLMHIDMDCFFVSVGLRSRPELSGTPVAVAHARGAREVSRDVAALRRAERDHYAKKYGVGGSSAPSSEATSDTVEFSSMSELASCSYEARAKGVKNGMFLGPALKLCPELKTIPYDFEAYQEVAKDLYDIVASYTLNIQGGYAGFYSQRHHFLLMYADLQVIAIYFEILSLHYDMNVQAVSCDEMLVDVTEVLNESRLSDPLAFADVLRKRVREKTGCNASVGMGCAHQSSCLAYNLGF